MAAADSGSGALVMRALDAQRARTGRVLTRVRLAGVGAALVLAAVMGHVAQQSDWRVLTPILAMWAVGAGVLAALAVWSERGARWAGVGVAALDVPLVFLVQARSLPVSPSPGGVAGFALGLFVLLVLLGTLALSKRQTALVAIGAAIGEIALQRAAGVGGGAQVAAVVVLGCAAAAAMYLVGRVRALVDRVASEERKRERLGRYFSPAVAERVQSRLDAEAQPDAQELTVLFSDIRDFTAASAALSPAEVVRMLN